MMRFFCFAMLFGVLCQGTANVYAQTHRPGIVWEHTYGGSYIDDPLAIVRVTGGGFIAAGVSQSTDGTVSLHHGDPSFGDYFILRVDDTGRFLWRQVLGGNGVDVATDVRQTTDGGFVVAGHSTSINGDITDHHGSADTYDVWIVKLSDAGAVQWTRSFGGSDNDKAFRIRQTSDGGYIVAGTSASLDGDHLGSNGGYDCWVLKLHPDGSLQWQRSFGGSLDDIAYAISETADHGYIVAASASSNDDDVTSNDGLEDYWVLKLDSTGVLQWQHTFGGSGDDEPYDIVQTRDGGYAVAGYSNSRDHDVTGNHGQEDMWVVKLSSEGSLVWEHSLGGSGIESASRILELADSSLVLDGYTTSADGDVTNNFGGYDVWFVRLNGPDGTLREQRTFGGRADDIAYGLDTVNDSTFMLVAGSNSSDHDISVGHGFDDYWLLEISPVPINRVLQPTSQQASPTAFPNPFHIRTTILFAAEIQEPAELSLYSATGQQVRRIRILAGRDQMVLDRGDLARGVYGYRVMAGGRLLRSGSIVVE